MLSSRILSVSEWKSNYSQIALVPKSTVLRLARNVVAAATQRRGLASVFEVQQSEEADKINCIVITHIEGINPMRLGVSASCASAAQLSTY